MTDYKKNIPDAGKADKSPKRGNTESIKANPPVQDQPAPAKLAAPGRAVEQPSPAKEVNPQSSKDEKLTTIPGMREPVPVGELVDFIDARDRATKGKPPENGKQADKVQDAAKSRKGRSEAG